MSSLSTVQPSSEAPSPQDNSTRPLIKPAEKIAVSLADEPPGFPKNQVYVKLEMPGLISRSKAWLAAPQKRSVEAVQGRLGDIIQPLETSLSESQKPYASFLCQQKGFVTKNPKYLYPGSIIYENTTTGMAESIESIGLVYDCAPKGANNRSPFIRK